MELQEVYQMFNQIRSVLKKYEDRWGYLSQEIELPECYDEDDKFKHLIGYRILNKLVDANSMLNWISKPIKAQGFLVKNENNRYGVENNELSSGYPIDWYNEVEQEWDTSRIEHNGEDYYIVGYGREKSIEGIFVRIRKT